MPPGCVYVIARRHAAHEQSIAVRAVAEQPLAVEVVEKLGQLDGACPVKLACLNHRHYHLPALLREALTYSRQGLAGPHLDVAAPHLCDRTASHAQLRRACINDEHGGIRARGVLDGAEAGHVEGPKHIDVEDVE